MRAQDWTIAAHALRLLCGEDGIRVPPQGLLPRIRALVTAPLYKEGQCKCPCHDEKMLHIVACCDQTYTPRAEMVPHAPLPPTVVSDFTKFTMPVIRDREKRIPMTDERLRELQWAATYVKSHKRRRGCRCAGSCDRCKPYNAADRKINADSALELIAEVEQLKAQKGRLVDEVRMFQAR